MATKINVGDYVKSYDFEHRKDCYVVGTVKFVGKHPDFPGCDRYEIVADHRVIEGFRDYGCNGQSFFPPVNGTPRMFGGKCDFVEKIAA